MTALKKPEQYIYTLTLNLAPEVVMQGAGTGLWGFAGDLHVQEIELRYFYNTERPDEPHGWLDVSVKHTPVEGLPYTDPAIEHEINSLLKKKLPDLFDNAVWSEQGAQDGNAGYAHLDGYLLREADADLIAAGFTKDIDF